MIRGLILLIFLAATNAWAEGSHGDLHLRGDFMQGGLVTGTAPPGTRLTLDNAAVPVNSEGFFVFGFHRDAKPQSLLVATYANGEEERRTLEIAQRTYGEQRIDGLPSRQVTPNEDDLRRIREDKALVDAARQVFTADIDFFGGWIWPTRGIVTGVYGTARFLNGQPRQPHYGIDIAAPAGTPVVAPAPGTVTMVHPDMFFTGQTLIIDHGMGVSSTFLHLSAIEVEKGQDVAQGDLIGRVGSTGRSTGPHLDWRINWFGARLDPELLAGPMPAPAEE